MSGTGGIFDKVKDFVKGNPDKVDSGLAKVTEAVNQRTGGRYADHLSKGGDLVRDRLGVPAPGTAAPTDTTTPLVPDPSQPGTA